jgi:hypothetical protein
MNLAVPYQRHVAMFITRKQDAEPFHHYASRRLMERGMRVRITPMAATSTTATPRSKTRTARVVSATVTLERTISSVRAHWMVPPVSFFDHDADIADLKFAGADGLARAFEFYKFYKRARLQIDAHL